MLGRPNDLPDGFLEVAELQRIDTVPANCLVGRVAGRVEHVRSHGDPVVVDVGKAVGASQLFDEATPCDAFCPCISQSVPSFVQNLADRPQF